MGDPADLREALAKIARRVKAKPGMTEGDIYSCFVGEGFFKALGYEEPGIDIRAQEKIGGAQADYDCVDDVEQSIFIIELKKPADEDILAYKDKQLKEKYVLPKRSRYGILSNGLAFHLFRREGERLVDELKIEDLATITERQTGEIHSRLKKPSYEYTNIARTIEEISRIEVKPLAEEVNREAFYEIFRLRQEETGRPTKFTRLVLSLMSLFEELLKEGNGEKSQFLEGAYRFWERSYAHKPSKLPESWRKLKKLTQEYEEKGDVALYRFMFCLETAHNITAKLILAKVAEDSGFKNASALEKLRSYMGLKFGEAWVSKIAYPFAVKETFDSLRYSLVASVFEEDIFDWWQDCSLRVGSNVQEWRTKNVGSVELFGDALARLFFALRTFDFRGLREDILGELYQHYFDPETRKALGEFYTPIEVVDYILDAVDYKGEKVLTQRLLDPACGSGTFIVEALKRYLHAAEPRVKQKGEAYWSIILRDLCERPKIIGFDINPFARLMAQMRFMMEIIPYYSRAQLADPGFVLTTIPIFRTDSLEIETKTGRFQKQVDQFAGDVRFFMRLPVVSKEPREGEEQFIPVSFSIPAWEKLRDTLHGNKESYFLLLRQCFEVIKESARRDRWELDAVALAKEFSRLFDDAEALATAMLGYVNPILGQIYILRKEYSDGRLIKTLEDLVLAGVLKNYFLYDYVVGNPPYVRVQMLDERQKREYKEAYQSAVGIFDLYVLFMERGINWLDIDGKIGYIVSNKFLNSDYGKGIRKVIIENCNICQLIDFGDTGVFKDATNYPLIFVFTRGISQQNQFTFAKVLSQNTDILEAIKKHLKENWRDQYVEVALINQGLLTEKAWSFSSPGVMATCEKMVKSCNNFFIENFARPHRCLYTGLNEAFIVDEKIISDEKLERQLLKKIIGGKDISRWRIDWKGEFIIYPYKESNGLLETVNLDYFPNIKCHLVKFKDSLMKRWYIKKIKVEDRNRRWFEFADPRNLKQFESVKILTPDISTHNKFVLDEGKFYSTNTSYVIDLDNFKHDPKFLLGLLNSTALEFYFKQISPFISGGYYRYINQYLERLPIKLPQTEEEQKLASEITERVEKVLALAKVEQRVQGFPEPYFEELKGEIDEWDEITWRAKRGYKALEPEIKEGAIVLGRGDEIPSEKISSETKVRYAVEALKGKSISKDQEVKIRVPRSDAAVKKILAGLEEDRAKLKVKPIAELENEINERVYRLYGLDTDDIKVIEEFLEKF